MTERVFIAIGSNVGDRVENINAALTELSSAGVKILSTGFLYESDPMYVEDQPLFLNTCVDAFTTLSPWDLLSSLKSIESKLGRMKTERNGPRNIDLDIIMYGSSIIESDQLVIPHPRMSERPFVLLPLADIDPTVIHPGLGLSVKQLVQACSLCLESCRRVIPSGLPNSVIPLFTQSTIVGILNVTPDSFSDGGRFNNIDAAVERAKELVCKGASIIDIGGESTRPNAERVGEAEEIDRVSQVVKSVHTNMPSVPISIDTYKATTARAALAAGAAIVNDVSGGLLDENMLPLIAELGVPFILTHAGQIGRHAVLDYGDGAPSCLTSDMSEEAIVETVGRQLAMRVNACIKAGVPRWSIILDPGLGFGKTGAVNFTILKRLTDIFSGPLAGFPVMIGASRKRFVRDFESDGSNWSDTEYEAMVGTAAVTAAAIALSGKVQFHRLHDVAEMKRVANICDKIFRYTIHSKLIQYEELQLVRHFD